MGPVNVQENPLVSVVMPAYNAAGYIGESIESVTVQTYRNWELIVVDDGSTDQTIEVVRKYMKDSRIRLIELGEDKGVAAARNAGIDNAKGVFIAFLDSDDIWLPGKLERQVAYHQEHSGAAISYTDYLPFDENGIREVSSKLSDRSFYYGRKKDVPRIYYENILGTLTVMVRRDVLKDVGGFDVSLRSAEDHDLWIRIAEKGYQFGYIRENLAKYRLTSGSLSRTPGKYKRQRKKMLLKHFSQTSGNRRDNMAWGTYYRHFGNEYYNRGNYKLAALYYGKAMTCFGMGRLGFRMFLFYIRSVIKSL